MTEEENLNKLEIDIKSKGILILKGLTKEELNQMRDYFRKVERSGLRFIVLPLRKDVEHEFIPLDLKA